MKTAFARFAGMLCLLITASCSSDPKVTETGLEPTNIAADSLQKETWFPETDFDTLRGSYTGNFGDGFINVVLSYVNDKKAIGYNVHKGLQRNIYGSVVQKADCFELTLSEPGDNEFDGVFTLIISKKDGSVDANWKANNPKIKPKTFTLKKQALKKPYQPKEGKYYFDFTNERVTEENFREAFSDASLYQGDNRGDITFFENGIVKYTYYPENQSNEQLESVKGSWRFKDAKTLVIEWSKNVRFKQQQMTFKLVQNQEEPPYFETADGKTSINMYLF